MKKEVKKKTRVEVNEETLQELNIYKAKNKFKSHNQSIKELLKNAKKKT